MSSSSHLTGRDDLQRPEGGLDVGGVLLELVQSLGDAGLQLAGVLARRAVGRDLVELGGRHVGDGLVVDVGEMRRVEGLTVGLNFSFPGGIVKRLRADWREVTKLGLASPGFLAVGQPFSGLSRGSCDSLYLSKLEQA